MIYIESDRLKLSFCEPGEGVNTRTRFDRAGFLTQVTLDGRHTFCGTEPAGGKHPSTNGAGLCSEIQCDELSFGKEEGEQFAKFGVGILTQAGGREYRFFRTYAFEPFAVTWKAEKNSVLFHTEPRLWDGAALEEELSFRAENNTVIKEYKFRNAGEKTLVLSEYCHNFLSLDGREVDSQFQILLPMLDPQTGMMPRSPQGRMRGTEYGMGFVDSGTEPSTIRPLADQIDRSGPFVWTVRDKKSGLCVHGRVSFPPQQLALWSAGNVLSPEVFHRFGLAPGEEIHYWRSWEFNA